MSDWWIERGDSESLLKLVPNKSVDLIATDPPYYRVKDCEWDRQWKTTDAFIEWLRRILVEFQRILKPNGSLYIFASPQMSARVECCVGEVFDVLNRITWRKERGRHKASHKEGLRSYFPASESIIFAEQRGSDGYAKGENQYETKCDELRGFVFEPLRKYFSDEKNRSGLCSQQIQDGMFESTGKRYVFDRHTFSRSQWELPTKEQYIAARSLFERLASGQYFRREYEELRREYEELRRTFSITADVPYTDVWDFPTVQYYKGKHSCEKPMTLMEHIVSASSKPGHVVLDPFCGSGSTGVAARKLGRRFVGIERDAEWVEISRDRVGRIAPRVLALPQKLNQHQELF